MKISAPIFRSLTLVAGTGLLLAAAPLHAAWVVLDNFDSYTAANLAGQGNWTLSTGSANTSTVVDQSGNKSAAMTATAANQTVYRSLGASAIANNSTTTVFFRFQSTLAQPNFNIGFTDVAAPANATFNINQSQFRVAGDAVANANQLYTRDATGFVDIGDFQITTWYNIWMVINNTTDRTTFFTSTGNADGTLLGDSTGYSFRVASANPITTLQVVSSNTSAVFLDDFYIDNTGQNLVNPIPEPAVSALAGLAAVTLTRRRRR